jgi:hypothetical protein
LSYELSDREKEILQNFLKGLIEYGPYFDDFAAREIGSALSKNREKLMNIPSYHDYINLRSEIELAIKRVDKALKEREENSGYSDLQAMRDRLANIERQVVALNPNQGQFS